MRRTEAETGEGLAPRAAAASWPLVLLGAVVKFQTAWQIARDRFKAQDRRIQRVQMAKPARVTPTVSRREADDVPYTPRPISILKPVPDDAVTIKRFVVEQFREANRKREKK